MCNESLQPHRHIVVKIEEPWFKQIRLVIQPSQKSHQIKERHAGLCIGVGVRLS